ncbi:uncharacterized protein ZBAI_09224 [Zygosaccharomyces bailii ISA1307]|nr:uncharacterized protein ZBAI_09224 [Zygosaccharomyces bailii ISA1307]
MNKEVPETRQFLTIVGDEEFYVRSHKVGSKYTFFDLQRIPTKVIAKNPFIISNDTKLIVLDSVNSGAGRTERNDFYKIVMKPLLDKLVLSHDLIKTTSHDSISVFAKSLDPHQSYAILVISGDTTISEFFNNLPQGPPRGQICLLPLPMGTGNAWASSLGLDSPVTAFHNFLAGRCKPNRIPLYKAIFPNGSSIVFFIIFSLGFHANLLHACEEPKYAKMGVERFQVAAKDILEKYDLDLSITAAGITKSYAYFAIINTPNLEAAYKPSPLSNALEQELRLLGYSSALKGPDLWEKIMQGYENKAKQMLPTNDDVIYKSIKKDFEVTLNYSPENSSRSKFEICCDGIVHNLLDFEPPTKPCEIYNNIHIQFLHEYSCFTLQVYST